MEDRTFIEWDKDDIDYLEIMKVDILALGMLTCIRKGFDLMRDAGHRRPATRRRSRLRRTTRVYDMLQDGDSIGVFQVESRAQINMLPRLKPREFYDLVVQVAIVRPGPIEGDMVHPYLRRRAGKEKAEFPSPKPPHNPNELRDLLQHTYGVPLFQEQAMKLAIVAAEFTGDEANQLRKAMATFRHVGGMDNFHAKLVGGMVAARLRRRSSPNAATSQIEGFGSYGFPESHALSFARLVYVSCWLKCFYPAVFCTAILNSQPMGFYAPAQLVRDALEHGVEIHPIDVNASRWDNTLVATDRHPHRPTPPPEPRPNGKQWSAAFRRDGHLAVRLGFRQIDGFRAAWAEAIATHAPFACVEDLARHLPPRALRLLADADALRSLHHDRRHGGWEARRTPPKQLPLFAATQAPELAPEPPANLPAMPLSEEVAADYRPTRLSLKDHPMTFLRPVFAAEGIVTCEAANSVKDGRRARVAGIVLVRQRPGKGNAIFVTIEDETGVVNALLWARDFEANRRAVMAARLMVLHGVRPAQRGRRHPPDDDPRRRPHRRTPPSVRRADPVRTRPRRRRELTAMRDAPRPQARPRPAIPLAPTKSHDPQSHRQGHRAPAPRPHHPSDVRLLPKSRDFH